MADESGFSSMFQSTYDDVCRYLIRRGVTSAVSRELASDVFEVAWRKWPPAPSAAMRPWLFKTASLVLNNHRRKVSNEADAIDHLRTRRASANASTSEEVLDVIAVLGSLGDADQEVLRLTAWEGLSPPEIAEVLGITTNAATVRLHRARRRLRAALQTTTHRNNFQGADHG